jgi:hypothetical protein
MRRMAEPTINLLAMVHVVDDFSLIVFKRNEFRI